MDERPAASLRVAHRLTTTYRPCPQPAPAQLLHFSFAKSKNKPKPKFPSIKRYCVTPNQLLVLPETCQKRFEAQYFELARKFEDFAVWANLQAHKQTKALIGELSERSVRTTTELPCTSLS
jgi:hypothetical protein